MSYQVLARKWRPKSFPEMVGQEHVLRAMVNALEQGRLHHAYLFTGTRGVGKTTIARILAKSLNCDQGITANPCGVCSACREIDEGRFVDLIEVDAASRTKVEDTRELLENVQYAPTRGRYKVYLIDEVHMLSGHSFNALLKTLEEPPAHVKFLLATTDPQKLPITILSRCLQFSLKAMTPERIVTHLKKVLTAEQVPFEEGALWALGRAAQGSMRDAMSLTDQAIAFGNGAVSETEVRDMLGTIDRDWVWRLLKPLADQDVEGLFNGLRMLAEHSPDYAGVLADVIASLHRIATAQIFPDAVDDSEGDRQKVLDIASQLTAEDVQLYYQLALNGRRDLPLAPDARVGFEMVVMRMMLFKPMPASPDSRGERKTVASRPIAGAGQTGGNIARPAGPTNIAPAGIANASVGMATQSRPAALSPVAPMASAHLQASAAMQREAMPSAESVDAPWLATPPMQAVADTRRAASSENVVDLADRRNAHEKSVEKPALADKPVTSEKPLTSERPVTAEQPVIAEQPVSSAQPVSSEPFVAADKAATAEQTGFNRNPVATESSGSALTARSEKAATDKPVPVATGDRWTDVLAQLGITGPVMNMARNFALEGVQTGDGNELWVLVMSPKHEFLLQPARVSTLENAIAESLGRPLTLKIDIREPTSETPDVRTARIKRERLEKAESTFVEDPFVKEMIQEFSAVVERHSIRPRDEA